MAAKKPSHTRLAGEVAPIDPDMQGVSGPPISIFDLLHNTKEAQDLKLKRAYMALIKASLRIRDEEESGG